MNLYNKFILRLLLSILFVTLNARAAAAPAFSLDQPVLTFIDIPSYKLSHLTSAYSDLRSKYEKRKWPRVGYPAEVTLSSRPLPALIRDIGQNFLKTILGSNNKFKVGICEDTEYNNNAGIDSSLQLICIGRHLADKLVAINDKELIIMLFAHEIGHYIVDVYQQDKNVTPNGYIEVPESDEEEIATPRLGDSKKTLFLKKQIPLTYAFLSFDYRHAETDAMAVALAMKMSLSKAQAQAAMIRFFQNINLKSKVDFSKMSMKAFSTKIEREADSELPYEQSVYGISTSYFIRTKAIAQLLD